MPKYEIVMHTRGLGFWVERTVFANFPEEALDEFLGTMDERGVKRTSPTTADVVGEMSVRVRSVAESRSAGWAANLGAWDKKEGESVR